MTRVPIPVRVSCSFLPRNPKKYAHILMLWECRTLRSVCLCALTPTPHTMSRPLPSSLLENVSDSKTPNGEKTESKAERDEATETPSGVSSCSTSKSQASLPSHAGTAAFTKRASHSPCHREV